MSEMVRVDSWFVTCLASAAVLGHIEATAADVEEVEPPRLTHEGWARIREAIGWHRSKCHPRCECEQCEKLAETYETAWIECQEAREEAEAARSGEAA